MVRPSLIAIAGVASLTAAENPRPVDQLAQGALQSAFQILRRDYIRRDELTFEELNRAALQGLLERLSFSAELVASGGAPAAPAPRVHAEFLAPDIAYLRPESLAAGEAALFERELSRMKEGNARHLILDLRAAAGPGSFDEAASVLQCFIPAGELMFKMKQLGREDAELMVSRRDPLWTGPVVALVDGDSNNAAETVAACLRARGRALVMGEPTRGAAVRHTEVRLDERFVLRYASAEMLLPDGAAIFRKGIEPQWIVRASREEKRKAHEGSRGGSLKPFVNDRVRPRFNEAALVAVKNPELDDYVRRTAGRPLPGDDGQVRDVVTQRALDMLRAGDLTGAAILKWGAPPPGEGAPGSAASPSTPAKP